MLSFVDVEGVRDEDGFIGVVVISLEDLGYLGHDNKLISLEYHNLIR